MITTATLGGLVTLLAWGWCDFLMARLGRKFGAVLTNAVIHFVQVIVLTRFAVWADVDMSLGMPVLAVAGIALLLTVAYAAYIKALSRGVTGVVAPLGNAYGFVTIVISVFVLGYELSWWHVVALLSIVVGVVLAVSGHVLSATGAARRTVAGFAVLAAGLWGVGFSLLDLAIRYFEWIELVTWIAIFTTTFSILAGVFMRSARLSARQTVVSSNRMAVAMLLLAGLLLGAGSLALIASTEWTGSAVIPAVIASASPLITAAMAYAIDKERLSLRQRFGAIVIIASVLVLNTT